MEKEAFIFYTSPKLFDVDIVSPSPFSIHADSNATLFFSIGIFKLSSATPQTITSTSVQQQLATLETSANGHLGVFAVDTTNNKSLCYRTNECFPLCSTFKVIDVAAILKKSITDLGLLTKESSTQHRIL